jgi:hypothetical protein
VDEIVLAKACRAVVKSHAPRSRLEQLRTVGGKRGGGGMRTVARSASGGTALCLPSQESARKMLGSCGRGRIG